MVVVLPAPFGPRNPKISPAPTEKPMPRTASTSPYFLARSSTSIDRVHARGSHPAQADRRQARRGAAAARRGRGPRGRCRAGARARRRGRSRPRRRPARTPGNGSRRSPRGARRRSGTAPASSRRRGTRAAPANRSRSPPSGRSRTFSNVSPRDARRLMARQHDAVGRDHDVAARPPVHAGARAIGVVVGPHEQDLDLAAQPLGGGRRHGARAARSSRARPAAARRGWRAPSRGTACWPAPAARRRSAPPARRTPRRARCCRGG